MEQVQNQHGEKFSHKKHFPPGVSVASLLILLIGILIGYYLYAIIHQNKTPVPLPVARDEGIEVPANAVVIQKCSTHKGALYVEPQNIPYGPIYLTNKGKVIGIEFMVDIDAIGRTKMRKILNSPTIPINHVQIEYSPGHPGFQKPHYHIDMYQVDQKTEDEINCESFPENKSASISGRTTLPVTSPFASGSAR